MTLHDMITGALQWMHPTPAAGFSHYFTTLEERLAKLEAEVFHSVPVANEAPAPEVTPKEPKDAS